MRRVLAVRAEIIKNITRNRSKLLIITLITIVIGVITFDDLNHFFVTRNTGKNVAYLDFVIMFFKGVKPYVIRENEMIDLPFVFIVVNLFLAFLIGDNLLDDSEKIGYQIILRCVSRVNWWLAKCIWIICAVIVYYATIFMSLFIVWAGGSRFKGKVFELNTKEMSTLLGVDSQYINISGVVLFILMMILTSIAVSFVQLLFTLFFKSILGFMSVAILQVLSCSITSSFLIGNYLMFKRIQYIDIRIGAIVNIVFILLTIIIGMITVNRKEYY
ncbi:MAG: hypothetical protein ACI4E1_05290 [Lachnospira sp.]